MKKCLVLLMALCLCTGIHAQQVVRDSTSTAAPYAYCEIIAYSMPTNGKPVVLDFGQKSSFTYNMMKDKQGHKLDFNSGVEALNYMTARGWEFVQAFTSGEDNDYVHYLLRIDPKRLTDAAQKLLQSAPPSTEALQ